MFVPAAPMQAARYAARPQFSGKSQLSQKEIDQYREKIGIADPIQPENTSKTVSGSRFAVEYSTLVGVPSALYKLTQGDKVHTTLFQRLKTSAQNFLWGQEHNTVVGLNRKTFTSSSHAEKEANKINATPVDFIPYQVAFHAPHSKKVLTFITNNPAKAAELREKRQNPFTDSAEASSVSSSSSENVSIAPSASDQSASGVTGLNPFAHKNDSENPFQD